MVEGHLSFQRRVSIKPLPPPAPQRGGTILPIPPLQTKTRRHPTVKMWLSSPQPATPRPRTTTATPSTRPVRIVSPNLEVDGTETGNEDVLKQTMQLIALP